MGCWVVGNPFKPRETWFGCFLERRRLVSTEGKIVFIFLVVTILRSGNEIFFPQALVTTSSTTPLFLAYLSESGAKISNLLVLNIWKPTMERKRQLRQIYMPNKRHELIIKKKKKLDLLYCQIIIESNNESTIQR